MCRKPKPSRLASHGLSPTCRTANVRPRVMRTAAATRWVWELRLKYGEAAAAARTLRGTQGSVRERSERVRTRFMLDGYPMESRHLLKDPVSVEPAEPGVLLAAEGNVLFIRDGHVVDMGHARVDPLGEPHGPVQIATAYRRRQSVLGHVRQTECVLLVRCLDDRHDRAEGFLERDVGLGIDV